MARPRTAAYFASQLSSLTEPVEGEGKTNGPTLRQAQDRPKPVSRYFTIFIAVLGVVLFAAFVALGTWQVQRLTWKLALIERVNQRVHAPATAAPGPELWSQISAATDEYRHVRVTGSFLKDRDTFVKAVTERGSGFWLLTPLRATDGTVVLVNRGFVQPEFGRPDAASFRAERTADAATSPISDVSVVGLLRISEPKGGFLRKNDAAGDNWFSRDVPAIAAARGLSQVAPFFVDAEAVPVLPSGGIEAADAESGTEPIAGLTVITFHNSHLVYALTWYALALMVVGAAWVVRRERRR